MRVKLIGAILGMFVAVGAFGGIAASHEVPITGDQSDCVGKLLSADAKGHKGIKEAAIAHSDEIGSERPSDFVLSARQTCLRG